MSPEDLDKALAAIAANAKTLRDAGVVGRVTIDAVSFELADTMHLQPMQQQPEHVLDDPETFGGFIPQRRMPLGPSDPEDLIDEE